MRGPSPLYIEERHRALGRDATFSWSRALTHPPRCNRTRHRGRHLDFVGVAILVSWGPPSWIGSRGGRHLGSEVVGAAILDRKSWGPPSWTRSDVKNAKVGPILLTKTNSASNRYFSLHLTINQRVYTILLIQCFWG